MTAVEKLRTTARSGARTIITGVGQLSAPLRMTPSFLIAGAQRCATTSLFRMLAQHPEVHPPALNKGVHYFDTADKFRRGLRYYTGHFPLRRPATSTGITGEGSPYYIFHPLAVQRIAAALPEAKLVVLLRDPAERAFSAYKQELKRGFETLPFAEALDAEARRLDGEEERIISDEDYQSFSHQHHAYVARGRYAAQLERAFATLGRERVLVIDAEDFMLPGLPQWQELTDYLGISPWTPQDVLQSNARPSSPMPEDIRSLLVREFAEDDERLAELLGYTPSWRR